jgi:RND family efflux transporter MFP subunit
MRKDNFNLLVLLCANLVMAGTTILGAETQEERIFAVRTAKAETRTIAQTLVKTGSLSSPAVVDISPRVAGRLETTTLTNGVELAEGSIVKKGDVIATLDAREYAAKYEAAAAAVEFSAATLKDKTREYERIKKLLAKAVATEQEADLAESAMLCAQAELNRAKADMSAAKLNLDETKILSPMDGAISSKKLYSGAMVSSSDVIYTITQTNPLRVLFDIPTTVFPLLKVGTTKIRLTVDAYPDENVDLVVDEAYPTANELTRTITVRAKLENAQGRYKAGMFVSGEIFLNQRENVLVVPYNALHRIIDKFYVYTIENDKAKLTPVNVGIRYDDVIEITEGISNGTEVITDGKHRLADGSSVRVVVE